MEYKANEDFISDFAFMENQHHLLATSADGCLSVFDIRRKKPLKVSDNQADELLSVAIVKVMCAYNRFKEHRGNTKTKKKKRPH
jgi:WD40 repeat protein